MEEIDVRIHFCCFSTSPRNWVNSWVFWWILLEFFESKEQSSISIKKVTQFQNQQKQFQFADDSQFNRAFSQPFGAKKNTDCISASKCKDRIDCKSLCGCCGTAEFSKYQNSGYFIANNLLATHAFCTFRMFNSLTIFNSWHSGT